MFWIGFLISIFFIIKKYSIINNNPLPSVQPPKIPAFLLFGFPIDTVRTPAYALSDLDDIYAC